MDNPRIAVHILDYPCTAVDYPWISVDIDAMILQEMHNKCCSAKELKAPPDNRGVCVGGFWCTFPTTLSINP